MASVQSETNLGQENPKGVHAWPQDIAKYIAAELEQGAFSSEEDLLCEAVRQLHDRRIELLRREIQVGIDDFEHDRVTHLADEAALARHMQEIWQIVEDRAAKSKSHQQ
ncbi:MAG: hypothetical protein JWM11_7560 [Planctomycetaceae bacterium]|nr:hypothetical protein [Planctomycetaceae bacterium]